MPEDAGTTGQVNLPNQGQVTTAQESPQEKAGAMQSWLNTAGGGGAPTAGGAPKPDTQSLPAGSAAPQLPQQPAPPPQTIPVPVTSLKRGGLLGVMDSMADVIVGKQRPELGKDPDGNVYIKQHDMTRGEQWAKIAGEAMVGAAAGYAAGKGRGNRGAAPLAGIQAQQQMAGQQKANMRQDVLDSANHQMLQMKMAEEAWKAARLKTTATQEDVKYMNEQEDRLTSPAAGGRVIGTAAHPGDIADILKTTPDVMNHLVNTGQLRILANILPDGTQAGIKAILMPESYGNQILSGKVTGHHFNPVSGQMETFTYSDPVTQRELDVNETAAGAAKLKYDNDKTEQGLKAATTEKTKAETGAIPSEIASRQATAAEARARTAAIPSEIAKNWAEAHKAQAEADKAAANSKQLSGPLVKDIGTGQIDPGRLSYLLARNPDLMNAVVEAYPDFDPSKIASYASSYKEFTSGTIGTQLNSGGTVLQHLNELRKLNTNASHNPMSPEWNAYHNKLDTVAPELAKFYGDATIPAINALKSTLGANLPGMRDAAIKEQSKSMSDKFNSFRQQWKNAAPSAAYEPKMPWISPEGEAALGELNTAYQGAPAAAPAPPAAGGPATPKTPPPAPIGTAGTALNKSDNKQHYVDAQGNDLGVAE